MDGTETGRGRPGEPAPRWRTLLERARLGGRTGEQDEIEQGEMVNGHMDGQSDDVRPLGAASEPLPRRSAGNGNHGRPAGIGYPAELDYGAEPAYPAAHGQDRVSGEPGESRYALLENGYDPGQPPAAPQYAAPAEPRYAPAVETRYAAPPEPRYPPAVETRYAAPPEPRYPPAVDTRYPTQASGGYRPEFARPAGIRDPAVDTGYPRPLGRRESRPDAEVERAISVLRRDLGTPRVLAFANPKGGVHKTTATVLAAATVGSVRGRGVLAWDDNELRGTLGLRAGSARHARTVRHLIADLTEVESRHGAGLTDRLDDYLRHASDGSYDVLAGEESPRFAQRLDQHTVRRVLELLRRTHDVICVDTGNNVESVNWQTVLQAADQLVVTTVPREDAAFTADWMLDLLHEVGLGDLADNAVTLLSCPTPTRSPLLDDLVKHFGTRTRAVAVVPYDPALETGSSIEYADLQDETRQAWLRAASAMIEPFVR